MPLLIAALLGLSAAIIVLYPLLGLDRDSAIEALDSAALSDDAERERSAKLALRDVNFDYRLGNLEEDDYVTLRDRYERRALAAMKTRYEREQALDELIDRQLGALRAQAEDAAPVAGPTISGRDADADRGTAVKPGKYDSTRATPSAAGTTRPSRAANGVAPGQIPRVRRRREK